MKSLARGAVVVAAGGLISKIIGAVYRVPLTAVLGAEGIGLYQMVFPVYCALLTFSSAGLPSALSGLIAKNRGNAAVIFRRSLVLFCPIGLAGSVIMCVFGGFFAKLQGNSSAGICYAALSPSVFLVSVISCVRGYFQGHGNMSPTAVSQVAEQIVKTVFGLAVCRFFRSDVRLAAAMASLAVTVSELFAAAYLLIRLKIAGYRRENLPRESGAYKRILALTVPVGLTALLLPLGHFADSFIVINALGGGSGATALYGIYSGGVAAITGAPVALAYGAAAACVPYVSGGKREEIVNALRFTGVICIPFTLFFTFFSRECIDLLYGRMSAYEKFAAGQILGADAISVTILSFLQTANAVLLARGKQRIPLYSLSAALFLRAGLCFSFCRMESVGILGAPIAANFSLAVALAVNLRFALAGEDITPLLVDLTKSVLCSILCVLCGFFVYNAIGGRAAFLLVSFMSAAAYLSSVAIFGAGKEIFGLKSGQKKRTLSA